MSLDVSLYVDDVITTVSSGIFVRRGGATVEISEEEWRKQNPDRDFVSVGAGIRQTNEIYCTNITHNLGNMAKAAGIYWCLWRPDEHDIKRAKQLIDPLTKGLGKLKKDPDHYRKFDSPNGWGVYDDFVSFVERYLYACRKYPDADVEVSR